MAGLLFLFEVAAFCFVAYWTYTNDRLGPEAGSKGLLRIMEAKVKAVAAARQRAPKWRQSHRTEPKGVVRTRRKPVLDHATPAWKRRLDAR